MPVRTTTKRVFRSLAIGAMLWVIGLGISLVPTRDSGLNAVVFLFLGFLFLTYAFWESILGKDDHEQ